MTYHARLITRVLFPSDTISFSFKSWKTTFNTQPQRARGAGAVRRCENGMGGMTHNFYCLQSATVLHTIKLDVGSMINRTNPDPALQMLLKQRKAWFSFEITFDSHYTHWAMPPRSKPARYSRWFPNVSHHHMQHPYIANTIEEQCCIQANCRNARLQLFKHKFCW